MSVCSQILRIANDTSSKCLHFRIFFKFSFMVTVFFKLKEFRITAMYLDTFCGPGSSVGIATELRSGRSGIESRWDEIFRPGAHPAFCKTGTGSFPGVKCGRGVLLTTRPLLVPRSWKSRAIPLPTLWATPGL